MTSISQAEMVRQAMEAFSEDYVMFGMMPGDHAKAPPPSVGEMTTKPRRKIPEYHQQITCGACGREWTRTGRHQGCQHCGFGTWTHHGN